MPVLATFKSEYQTALNCVSHDYRVISALPWPVVQFEFKVEERAGSITVNNKTAPTYYVGFPNFLQIYFQDVLIASEEAKPPHNFLILHDTAIFLTRLPIEALSLIERKRQDDIQLSIQLVYFLKEMANISEGGNPRAINYTWADLSFTIDLSEKKWLKLLSDIGYSDKWIIEIDRPKIEEFHDVIEHLNKAADALYKKKEPENVLRDLRATRDSFKTVYESKKKEIDELIDRDSPGEAGKLPKSKRVEEIFVKVSSFLQIGPHNDKYKVTYADAQLAYREFVSLLSYLSSVMKEVEQQ